jgi:hypothetical protein
LRTIGRTRRVRNVLAMNLSGVARRHFVPDLHTAPNFRRPEYPKFELEALYD